MSSSPDGDLFVVDPSMDPARLDALNAYGDDNELDDINIVPSAKRRKVAEEVARPDDEEDEDEDEDESSSEDMRDLIDQIETGKRVVPEEQDGERDSKTNKGKRGKRTAEARKRRHLMRMELLRQEIGAEDGQKLYDPVIKRHLDRKRIFITNISFATSETDLKRMFGECGEIRDFRMSKDSTEKFSGYCHVGFTDIQSANDAIRKYDGFKHDGRYWCVQRCENSATKKIEVPWYLLPSTCVNYVSRVERHPQFRFPDNIQKQMVQLFKEHEYDGKNISCIKNAWEKTYNSDEKLDVGEWGFKNFSTAFRTFPYFRMEREAPLHHFQAPISRPMRDRLIQEERDRREVAFAAVVDVETEAKDEKTEDDIKNASPAEQIIDEKDLLESAIEHAKKKVNQHKGCLTYIAHLR